MYSLDFAAQVSRICMDEIRNRGLRERKILRKSVPNSVLLLKVFRKQNCTADDLTHVSIHSVATLMQDTLWCCQERIVPKKVWRVINYETCTLNELSRFISKRGENLLVEILDFLVQLMRYKEENQMDAYHLGEAMGKVTLGPADCDPIIAEKAGHFLTRMIIEHSKTIHGEKQSLFRAEDSRFAWPSVSIAKPMSKSEAARAKAKSYNRLIKKIRTRNFDPLQVADVALISLLEDDFQQEPPSYNEPYISIFSKSLEPSDAILSPVLFRLVTEASKAIVPIPKDPFANTYLSNKTKIENQVRIAFDDFVPLIQSTATSRRHMDHGYMNEKTFVSNNNNHKNKSLNMINSSISHMKLNLRKHKSQGGGAFDVVGEETLPVAVPPAVIYQKPRHEDVISNKHSLDQPDLYSSQYSATTTDTTTTTFSSNHSSNHSSSHKQGKHHQMKSMMKRVIKIGTIAPMKKTTIY